jgi:hypothetical protein
MLSRWFNEIVFATPPPMTIGPVPFTQVPEGPFIDEKLMQQLRLRWDTELAGARKIIGGDEPRPALIPKVQNALSEWLSHLKNKAIISTAQWGKVEVIEDPSKGPYGYLTVIRPEDPNAPGLGIGAWLAERVGRPKELRSRLGFFDNKPCPIRTLALFRHDGESALSGETKDIFEEARKKKGRDVRIQKYEPRHIESLLAFQNWLPSVTPEVQAAGSNGAHTLKEFVTRLSKELLDWIHAWSQPVSGGQP